MIKFLGDIRWWLWQNLPNRFCWAVEHEDKMGYTIFFALGGAQATRIGRKKEGRLPFEQVFVRTRDWWLG